MIPKPKHCEQNWLTMQKAEGGRICSDCNKLMTNFSKMSWSKIERIHTESNEPVCGMYSQKQLDNWGHEVPSVFSKCSKSTAVLTSIFAALSLQPAEAKPLEILGEEIHFSPVEIEKDSVPIKKTKRDSVSGIVFDDGTGMPLKGATVFIKNSELKIITNETGRFKFEIPDTSKVGGKRILKAEKTDYLSDLKIIDDEYHQGHINLFLQPSEGHKEGYVIAFGFGPPTKKQIRQDRWRRFKWKVKNLFK